MGRWDNNKIKWFAISEVALEQDDLLFDLDTLIDEFGNVIDDPDRMINTYDRKFLGSMDYGRYYISQVFNPKIRNS